MIQDNGVMTISIILRSGLTSIFKKNKASKPTSCFSKLVCDKCCMQGSIRYAEPVLQKHLSVWRYHNSAKKNQA